MLRAYGEIIFQMLSKIKLILTHPSNQKRKAYIINCKKTKRYDAKPYRKHNITGVMLSTADASVLQFKASQAFPARMLTCYVHARLLLPKCVDIITYFPYFVKTF